MSCLTHRLFGRCFVISVTSALALTGAWLCWQVLSSSAQPGVVAFATFTLFSILFGWLAYSFSVASLGFASEVGRIVNESSLVRIWTRPPDSLEAHSTNRPPVKSRTAVLVPVYNECPEEVFSAIEAMIQSLQRGDEAVSFDFFVLSDSTDESTWLREQLVWQVIQTRILEKASDSSIQLYYRHRSNNESRKSGNVAEFCRKWGSGYDFMIVLDADSLMSGETLVELTRRMEADSRLGILQVPPVPILRRSLFARLQQFSAEVYGPVYGVGFDRWTGDDANYFGHNAIIRVEAFMRHCELPRLPGNAPLGGEILSHDFVEAALIRRAGYKVQLATDLDGSYEECPTTIEDFAKRDQRWCQGNLQHARLIFAEGFRPINRWHFATGIMSYLSALLWLTFIASTLVLLALDRWQTVPTSHLELPIALWLFGISMSLLLLPKGFGWLTTVLSHEQRKNHGGLVAITTSVLLETICSALIAPIMAFYHSRFVISILRGTTIEWTSQQRDERGVSWIQATKQYYKLTLLSLATTVAMCLYASANVVWFVPLVAGPLFSIPLSVAMGSRHVGGWLLKHRLLLTRHETNLSVIALRRRAARARIDADESLSQSTSFERVVGSTIDAEAHIRILEAGQNECRIDPETAEKVYVAAADGKLASLTPSERLAVLADPVILRRLAG